MCVGIVGLNSLSPNSFPVPPESGRRTPPTRSPSSDCVDQVHGLRVQENIIYESEGHTIMLQTGAETANIFSNNLVAVTREGGVLNTDLTPASFLLTNLNNVVRGNTACVSHGYGFWYDLKSDDFTDIFSVKVCPHGTVVRDFTDNTAHSNAMGGVAFFPMDKQQVIPLVRATAGHVTLPSMTLPASPTLKFDASLACVCSLISAIGRAAFRETSSTASQLTITTALASRFLSMSPTCI